MSEKGRIVDGRRWGEMTEKEGETRSGERYKKGEKWRGEEKRKSKGGIYNRKRERSRKKGEGLAEEKKTEGKERRRKDEK